MVNTRLLLRKVKLSGLRTAEQLYPAIRDLQEAGWLLPVPSREGQSGGRMKADFRLNPKLRHKRQPA